MGASEVGPGAASEVGAGDGSAMTEEGGAGTSMGKPAAAQMVERTSMVLAWSAGSVQDVWTQGVTLGVNLSACLHEHSKSVSWHPRAGMAVARHWSEHEGNSAMPWAAARAVMAEKMRPFFILMMLT